MDDPKRPKPGPDPEHLKIDGDWEDAMKKAMQKPRPEGGWPDPEKPPPEPDDEEEAPAD